MVVANEWKDANDKVMPVKQWLEERRHLQVNTVSSTDYAFDNHWTKVLASSLLQHF